jgi:hypothetical protein
MQVEIPTQSGYATRKFVADEDLKVWRDGNTGLRAPRETERLLGGVFARAPSATKAPAPAFRLG